MILDDNPKTSMFGQMFWAEARPNDNGQPYYWPHETGWIDLTSDWNKSIRKSYRSLINWGKKNMAVNCICGEYSHEFGNYTQFHKDIAGRSTRSAASWDLQWMEVANGRGELIMGRWNNELVAGAVFIDGKKVCVYWSAVYERKYFDKPLAHYTLWLAINHAQKRGLKWFELGGIPKQGLTTDKEYQIGYFKRGFATHIVPYGVNPLTDDVAEFRRK